MSEEFTNQSGHKVKKTISPDGKNVQFSLVSETEQSAIPQVENKILIELDDKKYNKLLEEKNQLEHALEKIAQKEFDERSSAISQKLGIDKEEINYDNLKGFESMLQKKEAEREFDHIPAPTYEGAPLNPPIDYDPRKQRTTYKLDEDSKIPIDLMEYDNVNDCITDLSSRAKNGDKESARYLAQIVKNTFKGNATWEYSGKSSLSLVKNPVPILPTDSDSVKQYKKKKNAELMKDKLSWERVE